jgi:predicted nuclease of predicted toxin-antitoxin system
MARLYTNENFPLQGAQELRRLGHDVLTVQEAGKALQAISDEDVLAFAKAQERAVVSLNRKHFVRLHQTRQDHAGIVVCTFDPDFATQALRIHQGLREQEPIAGKLIRVNRPGPEAR